MPTDDDLVELAKFPGEPEASVLVARLRDAGIHATVFGGHIKNADLFFALTLRLAVMVRRADLEAATAVMQEEAPPEGWEDEAEQMPAEDE
jgi:hypothetical protein